MRNMLKALYGNLCFIKKSDYIVVPLKVLYIIYSLPFLLFSYLLAIRSFGGLESSEDEKVGIIKKAFLHFAAIFFSFILWGLLINALLGIPPMI